jgi:three-Cys-motif partner protein
MSYVDAFAGPGEYPDGGSGSPLIALKSARRLDVSKYARDIHFVFIEKAKGRFDNLQSLLKKQTLPEGFRLAAKHGACEEVLIAELDQLDLWKGPMFVNFDGWGVDTPQALIKKVGEGKRPEVLVTFGSQWFTRFATKEDAAAGDRVFGDDGWRAVTNLPTADKKRFLVDEYRRRLMASGFPYQLTFELEDEKGNPLFLVFATGEPQGVVKMKDAMWRVDTVNGSKFRDPRDPNQMAFSLSDSDPNLSLLRQQILERVSSGPKTLADLKNYVLFQTVFKQTHAKMAVDELEAQHQVTCARARAHERYVVTKAPESLF